MLTIEIGDNELFDERTNEFRTIQGHTLTLEHSLISLSKWESKWKKPLLMNLSSNNLSYDETMDYIKCMTINSNVPDDIYLGITKADFKKIVEYVNDSMSATTFWDQQKKGQSGDVLTSEVIYYQMIRFGVPFECQKWHLNRLLTLIKVCALKENPQKMSELDLMTRNAKLNAARRAKLHTKG